MPLTFPIEKHTSHTPARVMRHSSDCQMAVATSGGGRAHWWQWHTDSWSEGILQWSGGIGGRGVDGFVLLGHHRTWTWRTEDMENKANRCVARRRTEVWKQPIYAGNKGELPKLQRLQNWGLRILFKTQLPMTTNELHIKAGVLPLSNRRTNHKLCLMYYRSHMIYLNRLHFIIRRLAEQNIAISD